MKRLVYLIVFLPLFAFGQVKISDLPAATNVNNSDKFLLIQSGTSKQVPYSVFKYSTTEAATQINDSLTVLRDSISNEISDSISSITTGTSISFGSQYQIPYTNSGTDDFNYSNYLKYDGNALELYNSTGGLNIGLNAGDVNTGNQNTFVGSYSGAANASGDYNSFYGTYSGQSNTTSSYNTFLGHNSGNKNTTGAKNTYVGYKSGYAGTTSTSNSFFGYQSGAAITDGSYNVLVGYDAGLYTTTGDNNTFLGYKAGMNNVASSENTFLGYRSGYLNTSGEYNLYVGLEAGRSSTSSDYNSFLGYKTGYSNTTGYENTFLGTYAGYSNVSGYRNVILGNYAGYNSTGNLNVFLGYQAGQNETGSNKLYISNSATDTLIYGEFDNDSVRIAGDVSITGNLHVDGSFDASLTPAGNDTEIQYNDGGALGSSSNFTWNGVIFKIRDQYNNINIGEQSGNGNLTGISNVSLGYRSGYAAALGGDDQNKNVSIGYEANKNSGNVGDSSVFLGYQSGLTLGNGGSNNLFLGFQSGYNETGSNKLYIENSNSATPLIHGDFAADSVTINGTISSNNPKFYASCADSAEVVPVTVNIWEQITGDGNTLLTNYRNSDFGTFQNDSVQIPNVPGWYTMKAAVCLAGTSGDVFEVGFNVDNVLVGNRGQFTRSTTNNAIASATAHMDYYMSGGEWIKIMIRNTGGSTDPTIINVDWTIKYDD